MAETTVNAKCVDCVACVKIGKAQALVHSGGLCIKTNKEHPQKRGLSRYVNNLLACPLEAHSIRDPILFEEEGRVPILREGGAVKKWQSRHCVSCLSFVVLTVLSQSGSNTFASP